MCWVGKWTKYFKDKVVRCKILELFAGFRHHVTISARRQEAICKAKPPEIPAVLLFTYAMLTSRSGVSIVTPDRL